MASLPSTSGLSALLLGATGATGSQVLRELLASKEFTRVIEVGRRVTSSDILANMAGKEKLSQKTIDFEKIEEAGLKEENPDVVIITLGTSRAVAGSAEKFIKVDREYPIRAAKAAKTDSASQRLIYLSSIGANPSSFFLYAKSKGLTELGLAGLGYNDFVVFRPGLLDEAGRAQPRMVETIYSKIVGIMPTNTAKSLAIPVKDLGRSIVLAAAMGSSSLPSVADAQLERPQGLPPYHIIFNRGALELSKVPQ